MMQSIGQQQPPGNSFQQQQQGGPLHQNQQQQQQQQPQQPQQQFNANGNGQPAPNGGGSQDAASSSQPEYTLAGILHYLQSEWRKYEKDRNEWEIERAEMRARIALLEGERRGVENLKTDLMRRVKMLEYALRQERSKYLSGSSAGAPLKNPAVAGLEKEAATFSGRSSPSLQDSEPNIASIHPRNTSTFSTNTLNFGTLGGAQGPGSTFSMASLSRQPTSSKDHKTRDKSREYLKACLREISYLTSANVLNPLPERAYPSATNNNINQQGLTRPRKAMGDDEHVDSAVPGATNTASRSTALAEDALSEVDESQLAPSEASTSSSQPDVLAAGHPAGKQAPRPPSPQPYSTEPSGSSSDSRTTVFQSKGEADEDWKALKEAGEVQRAKRERERRLRQEALEQGRPVADTDSAAGDTASLNDTQKAQRLMRQGTIRAPSSSASFDGEASAGDETITSEADEDVDAAAASAANDGRLWKLKKALAVHKAPVKALVFDSQDSVVFSASHDQTIKASRFESGAQPEGTTTMRGSSSQHLILTGHTASVTALAIASGQRRLFSGSADSSIRVWNLKARFAQWITGDSNSSSSDGPTPLEAAAVISTPSPVVHLALLPASAGDDSILAAAFADGFVRLYDVSASEQQAAEPAMLLHEFEYFGTQPSADAATEGEELRQELGGLPIATSISVVHSNIRRVAVSWSNSVVKLYSIDTGAVEEPSPLKLNKTFDQTPSTQINTIVTHPTLPLLFSGHEDKFIRVADLQTGQVILSMHGHKDAVVSLDIDPAGLKLLSGGHDGTVRVWDMVSLSKRFTGGSGSGSGGSESGSTDGSTSADDNEDDDDDDDDDDGMELELVQELNEHSRVNGEGVLAVRYHRTRPFFGSAGADGSVRIYG